MRHKFEIIALVLVALGALAVGAGAALFFAYPTPPAAQEEAVSVEGGGTGGWCFFKETRPSSQRLTPVQEFRLPKAQVRESLSWLPMSR